MEQEQQHLYCTAALLDSVPAGAPSVIMLMPLPACGQTNLKPRLGCTTNVERQTTCGVMQMWLAVLVWMLSTLVFKCHLQYNRCNAWTVDTVKCWRMISVGTWASYCNLSLFVAATIRKKKPNTVYSPPTTPSCSPSVAVLAQLGCPRECNQYTPDACWNFLLQSAVCQPKIHKPSKGHFTQRHEDNKASQTGSTKKLHFAFFFFFLQKLNFWLNSMGRSQNRGCFLNTEIYLRCDKQAEDN